MVLIDGVKYSCWKCIRGHRASKCKHLYSELFEVRRKGRPMGQCPACREIRRLCQLQSKCICGELLGMEDDAAYAQVTHLAEKDPLVLELVNMVLHYGAYDVLVKDRLAEFNQKHGALLGQGATKPTITAELTEAPKEEEQTTMEKPVLSDIREREIHSENTIANVMDEERKKSKILKTQSHDPNDIENIAQEDDLSKENSIAPNTSLIAKKNLA
ncbi:hypothetical protein SJAG_01694 [Schizosaccharomyces japonicus yFS275]|uniref:Copper-fist domain-containing protein n=1 Tax=Schizosaccharomyces japonicus (strain yFS275 / FY16936) TaxID=402676 RepID=B6JYM8_SCHJY|nr:hypothetical protein SJAG_01694 [Schizosaccharomyces japonicus yFS275]EEB06646.1 hypothetical protein SJAG_01694 [Schizosaccharomyces japonicus yFS275]